MLLRTLEIAHLNVPGAEPDWDFRPLLDRADDVRVVRADLRWRDWSRYSNRQGRKARDGRLRGRDRPRRPNGQLLFLGQLAPAFGPVQLYEYDFESRAHGAYRPTVLIDPLRTS